MTDTAPPGSVCGEHPDRPAIATCPRCGCHRCIACWHAPIGICHGCLMRDPAAEAPPVPWEMPNRGIVARFFETLKMALYPYRSAPALAREPVRPAVGFFLVTFVPLAALRGVIPFTRHLQFGPGFDVAVTDNPGSVGIMLDIAQAMGLSLALSLAAFAALALPYVSLARAFGTSPYRNAALRLVLYRGFLLGLSVQSVVVYAAYWCTPADYAPTIVQIARFAEIIPVLLLFFAMRATARMAHGVGPFASFPVLLVPLVLFSTVYMLAEELLAPLLPAATLVSGQGTGAG